MKIAFCTCVQIGLSCIESIIKDGGRFDLFLTLHDHLATKKSGRVYLDDLASSTGTPLFKLTHINDSDVSQILKQHEIDWLFIIGWSQIASKELLSTPRKGVIGAHPTLLPVGRGRAAIPWAIIKKLDKTGVTFFKMDTGVDTGPILDQFEIPLSSGENATQLYHKVNEAHEHLMRQMWPKLKSDSIVGQLQNEEMATYWEGRTPPDGELNLEMTVDEVDCLVRATTHPYPGAFIVLDSQKYTVWAGKPGVSFGKVLKFKDGYYTLVDFFLD